MKKLIVIALAAVMVLAIVCFAGAVEFTDSADIGEMNTEAVEVLSELKVIGGMGDGTFAPNGTLTRAQAAKIITYLVLGDEKAEALSASTASFTDVPTSHWACKYVNYCAQQGIVGGVGNNKFDPNGKLTGYAFGKMLLVAAAGYNAEAQGLVGADWDVNTNKLLKQENLNQGVTVNSKDMPRQDACRLALNFLFYREKDDPTSTLAYRTFGVTRMGGGNDKEDFFRPTNIYSTESAGQYWPGMDLTVKASPIYKAMGALPCNRVVAALGGAEPTSANMIAYRNGVPGKATTLDSTPLTADNTKNLVCTCSGVTSTFYYDATMDYYTIIQITTHAAPIVAATAPSLSSTGKVLEHGSVTINAGGNMLTCDSDAFTEEDVGSYAMFSSYGKNSWSQINELKEAWKPARTVTGVLQSEDASLKVGGTTYTTFATGEAQQVPGAFNGETYIAGGGSVGDTVTLVMDEYDIVYAVYKA